MDGSMFDGLFKFIYFLIITSVVSVGAWIIYGLYHLIKWVF